MSSMNDVTQVHRRITEEMWLLEKALPMMQSPQGWIDVKRVLTFFKDVVQKHFEWEDKAVFQVLVDDAELPMKQLIRELQKEHIVIMEGCDLLSDFVAKQGDAAMDSNVLAQFAKTARDLTGTVIQHCRKEDKDLYPYVIKKGIAVTFEY